MNWTEIITCSLFVFLLFIVQFIFASYKLNKEIKALKEMDKVNRIVETIQQSYKKQNKIIWLKDETERNKKTS